jgi:ribonuclease VapC
MVVDTSALVAVILGEPDAESYAAAITAATDGVAVSAATFVEAAIVLEARQGPDAARDLGLLLQSCGATVEPFTSEQSSAAIAAWRRFGKGRHPAALNFGDCFAYALAQYRGESLLFKGNDFAQTDIRSARE